MLTAGCHGQQSALSPRGPDAESYAVLTYVMTAGGTAIFLAVMALLAVAILRPGRPWRAPGRKRDTAPPAPAGPRKAGLAWSPGGVGRGAAPTGPL